MALQKRPSRGLSDLRTATGRSDTRIPLHKAYLRMSFLELERARRMEEIRTCRSRVDTIRARFCAIDAEMSALRANLDGSAQPAPTIEPRPKSPLAQTPQARRFQLTY